MAVYLDALATTYAEIMPPEFAVRQRAQATDFVEQYRAVFAAQHADPDGPRRAWYAEDTAGPVGIVEVRTEPADWEVDRAFPPPSTPRQLGRLYVLPRRHGTGLGQALLDLALGVDPAYLWIMAGNPRAEAFYRRNGFVPDGLTAETGPTWYHRPSFRMHRS